MIIVLACPLFASADWVEQRLTLEWRNWLTSYLLRAYFADRAFFKLKQQCGSLDNPDQVRTFVFKHISLSKRFAKNGRWCEL